MPVPAPVTSATLPASLPIAQFVMSIFLVDAHHRSCAWSNNRLLLQHTHEQGSAMRGVEYAELEAFLAVARERSFRRAADALAVSPSAISHTIRALEARLGARLVNRTTRSVSLTQAGQRLQARLAPAFADITGAVEEVASGGDRPAGLLRLTVPRVAAQMVLAPVLGRFLLQYPAIRLEVTVDDALVDSVADGFDAGIRLAEQVRRDMEGVPIGGALRGVVVGSPAYLTAHGIPCAPGDLHRFHWLNYRQPFSGRLLPWEFVREGEVVALSLEGPLASNDPDLLIAAALDGAGLAYVTEATIADHLAAGRLVRVLDEWCPAFEGWRLYYPRNRHLAPALKALIDFLSDPSHRRSNAHLDIRCSAQR
jgi:DNA-binding transcriptional LysR family regulator